MLNQVERAIADFKKGGALNISEGIAILVHVGLEFDDEINDCSQIDENFHALKNWASIFKNKTKLAATVVRNYHKHKSEIKDDVANLQSDY